MAIKKLKKSDIIDRSLGTGNLFDDTRLQIADLQHGQYPYTVEFEVELKFNYLFHIPAYHVVTQEKMSVQNASFSLIYPPALAPRFKEFNITVAPEKAESSTETNVFKWTFKNVEAMKGEPFGLPLHETVPHIIFAPTTFEYEGYAGKMDSWNNLGMWINSLNKGRDILDEVTKTKIKGLVAGAATKEEKVKILYEYMQSKTRYVSIQLGIGGYQPFEASLVDKTGYGDCKALSNYMVSMLKAVDIDANYTLVWAGSSLNPLQQDFPSSQFNHAIVAVPNDKDTLWLECTSQTNPFGYMGNHTGNRYALMILEDGAKVVKTPVYDSKVNLQSRDADVYIDLGGQGTAEITTAYSGLQYENNDLDQVLNIKDELKKWINNNTDIPSFDLSNFSYENKKDKIPTATVKIALVIPQLAPVSGKRIFLTPNLMNRLTFIPEANTNRKTPIFVKTGFTDVDVVRYHIPEQIYPEFVPEPIHIESIFGVYDAEYVMEQGLMVYKRKLTMKDGQFAPEHYQNLRNFYQDIKKADQVKVVFLSRT